MDEFALPRRHHAAIAVRRAADPGADRHARSPSARCSRCCCPCCAPVRASVAGCSCSAYVFVFRGTPLLVQIFLIYYGLGQFAADPHSLLWPFLREPYWCAILALALNTAAYGSEIIRGGLPSVPRGSIEAGARLRHVRASCCCDA